MTFNTNKKLNVWLIYMNQLNHGMKSLPISIISFNLIQQLIQALIQKYSLCVNDFNVLAKISM